MGRSKPKSYTLPSSPTHSLSSSSSSDFEFTISISPRSRKFSPNICPADELFYKGQLLPLHQSPRLSMVRTLLLASSSTSSSSDTTTTASRDSTGSSGSSNDSYSSGDLVLLPEGCDSSRPSSVAEEDEFKRLNNSINIISASAKKGGSNKYLNFSLARFSSVFRKESSKSANRNINDSDSISGPLPAQTSSVRRMSTSAREVIRKYLKKVKPLYEKLSQKPSEKIMVTSSNVTLCKNSENICSMIKQSTKSATISHSFSGNLRYPRRRGYVSSCPSSMRSSPSHSGILSRSGYNTPTNKTTTGGICSSDSSTMEELQNAIQGAIAHCKNSMLQNHNVI